MTIQSKLKDTASRIKSEVTVLLTGDGKAVIFVVLVVIFMWLIWPAPPVLKPTNSAAVIAEAKKALQADYDKKIAAKEKEVKDWQSRYIVSDAKYKLIVTKYKDLQEEFTRVTAPKTNEEIRQRFIVLGYPPIPVK